MRKIDPEGAGRAGRRTEVPASEVKNARHEFVDRGSRGREERAGRAAYVPLWPLTRREQLGRGSAGIRGELLSLPVEEWYDRLQDGDAAAADWRELAARGGYPIPAHELGSPEARRVWYRGYVQTYLERDPQGLAAIDDLVDFRRLMRAASLRVGSVLNQAELARDAQLTPPNVLFWRTQEGEEVDFVIKQGDRLLP